MDRLAERVRHRFTAGHRQTYVKVNAPVDVGVASVVTALSSIPSLCTISSCEGRATVTFTFGSELVSAIRFYVWFLTELERHMRRGAFRLQIVDVAGETHPLFELVFSPNATGELAKAISAVAGGAHANFE